MESSDRALADACTERDRQSLLIALPAPAGPIAPALSPQAADHAAQLRLLQRFLSPATTFLELCEDDYSLALTIAHRVKRTYAAVDISAVPISGQRLPANFHLALAHRASVPVPASSIDVAYTRCRLDLLRPAEVLDLLAEVYRALAPHGTFLCMAMNRLVSPPDELAGHEHACRADNLYDRTAARDAAEGRLSASDSICALARHIRRPAQQRAAPVRSHGRRVDTRPAYANMSQQHRACGSRNSPRRTQVTATIGTVPGARANNPEPDAGTITTSGTPASRNSSPKTSQYSAEATTTPANPSESVQNVPYRTTAATAAAAVLLSRSAQFARSRSPISYARIV